MFPNYFISRSTSSHDLLRKAFLKSDSAIKMAGVNFAIILHGCYGKCII